MEKKDPKVFLIKSFTIIILVPVQQKNKDVDVNGFNK